MFSKKNCPVSFVQKHIFFPQDSNFVSRKNKLLWLYYFFQGLCIYAFIMPVPKINEKIATTPLSAMCQNVGVLAVNQKDRSGWVEMMPIFIVKTINSSPDSSQFHKTYLWSVWAPSDAVDKHMCAALHWYTGNCWPRFWKDWVWLCGNDAHCHGWDY